MVNKRFLFGIPVMVMVLVFGMTVVGCDDEFDEFEFIFQIQNNSTFQITNVDILELNSNTVLQRDSSGIATGQSKTYTQLKSKGSPGIIVLTVTVAGQNVEVRSPNKGTMTSGEAKKLSLSGNSEDTLIISVLN